MVDNVKQKGFTLIELLVVVAIIGILAAVGVVAYNGYTSSAKKNATKNQHFPLFIISPIFEDTVCRINSFVDMFAQETTYKFIGWIIVYF